MRVNSLKRSQTLGRYPPGPGETEDSVSDTFQTLILAFTRYPCNSADKIFDNAALPVRSAATEAGMTICAPKTEHIPQLMDEVPISKCLPHMSKLGRDVWICSAWLKLSADHHAIFPHGTFDDGWQTGHARVPGSSLNSARLRRRRVHPSVQSLKWLSTKPDQTSRLRSDQALI